MTPIATTPGAADDEGRVVAAVPGQYTIKRDDRRQIVRISDLGVQRSEEVDRYLVILGDVIRDARVRDGRVRVLADLRQSPVRAQDAAERLRLGNMALYRAGDRVALLVESSLLRLQLRRNLVAEYQNIFLSQSAAEAWLTSTDDAPPQPD